MENENDIAPPNEPEPIADMPDTPPPESPTPNETDITDGETEHSVKSPIDTDAASPMEQETTEDVGTIDTKNTESVDDSFNEPTDENGEDSKEANDARSDVSSIKRPIDSPSSVTNSESSVRPNKRKRKGTPARHVQTEINDRVSETKSNPDDAQIDAERDSEVDKANNRKLLEDFERKSEVGLSRPVSQNGQESPSDTVRVGPTERGPVQRTIREKYGPPRLDLFGPPQHYLDLFGPPVREPTDNCSVVIRGIGEEEIYCGPGDKDPGDVQIPLRSNSHF